MDMMSYLMGRSAGSKNARTVVVNELPETGEPNIIYLVPKQNVGQDDMFDEYIWVNDDWELIGSTAIDISGKQDTMQFSTIPTADSTTVGKIIQYTGTTNANYTNGYFYIGTTDGTNYSWSRIDIQPAPDMSNYIAKNNTTSFTPSGDYNPATKKYVDDSKEISSLYLLDIGDSESIKSSTSMSKISSIIEKAYKDGMHSFNIYLNYYRSDTNYSSLLTFIQPLNNTGPCDLQTKPGYIGLYGIQPEIGRILGSDTSYTIYVTQLGLELSWNGDIPTVIDVTHYFSTGNLVLENSVLSKTNTTSYTPTGDYNPATKKYVDDAIGGALNGSY